MHQTLGDSAHPLAGFLQLGDFFGRRSRLRELYEDVLQALEDLQLRFLGSVGREVLECHAAAHPLMAELDGVTDGGTLTQPIESPLAGDGHCRDNAPLSVGKR
jgi:hypothetical protein